MRIISGMLIFAGVALSGAVCAESSSDEWQFQLTPYLWLPTIEGNLRYELPPGGGSPDVEIGPVDWLELLNVGILVSGSAKKGRFSLSSDIVYLSMTKNSDGKVISVEGDVPAGRLTIPVSADLNLKTQTDLDGLVWMLATGYTVKETATSSLDLFVGARLFSVDVSTRWDLTAAITTPAGEEILSRQGSIGRKTDLWDAIVGVRGHFGFGEGKWSLPYYLDVGTGDSNLTWQAMTGLKRAFGWGDLLFVYRHLEYDQGADGLMEEFRFSGPAFGATFRF